MSTAQVVGSIGLWLAYTAIALAQAPSPYQEIAVLEAAAKSAAEAALPPLTEHQRLIVGPVHSAIQLERCKQPVKAVISGAQHLKDRVMVELRCPDHAAASAAASAAVTEAATEATSASTRATASTTATTADSAPAASTTAGTTAETSPAAAASRTSPATTAPSSASGRIPPNENLWHIYVPVRVVGISSAVVATHAILMGSVLSANDLRVEQHDLSELPTGFLDDPSVAVGLTAARAIAGGSVVTNQQLAAAKIVQRGQSVTLMADAGGMSVRMAGRAITDGVVNQRIKVQNLSSGKVVEGIARSEQVVEIIFQ